MENHRTYIVTEMCPNCEREVEIHGWDTDVDGFEATCPYCGGRLMLCDECQHQENPSVCDWCRETDGCHKRITTVTSERTFITKYGERRIKKMHIKRGNIYYISGGYMTTGSEQRPGRPAVVVSNDMNNKLSSTIQVVYLTTQPKTNLPTHVTITGLKRESIALCEQITAVATERIGDFCGKVTEQEMSQIEDAMLVSLGIYDNSKLLKGSDIM